MRKKRTYYTLPAPRIAKPNPVEPFSQMDYFGTVAPLKD